MARGDHLMVECRGYSHHGIDCGDGQVVHFDSTAWRKLHATFVPQRAPRVTLVGFDDFALGRPVRVVPYDVCDEAEIVVARSLSCLGDAGYRLFRHNCEHFAVWCKTGRRWSSQVAAARAAARDLQRATPAIWLAWRSTRRLPTPARAGVLAAVGIFHVGRCLSTYIAHRRSYHPDEPVTAANF